jgi:tRNA(adenine34) deaminase
MKSFFNRFLPLGFTPSKQALKSPKSFEVDAKPSHLAPTTSGQAHSDPDEGWMRLAVELAHKARKAGEVPVGAVLVKDGEWLAEGWNCPIGSHDPTAHAEIVALRAAGAKVENYRLIDTTLYVTLEPCAMCMAALVHARVKRLVFGAEDPKSGAVCNALRLANAEFLNHRIDYRGGVLAGECSVLLKDFFKQKRGANRPELTPWT